MNSAPLSGITVVDATQALAGPYCTQLLADFGADVIKIERPGVGDQARGWGPPFVSDESTYFMGTNRNKRSMTLDLQAAGARSVLDALIDRADVLAHNVPRRPSQRKLGLDWDSVHTRNPTLIWAIVSGFGMSGPYAEKPGYDMIAQGMAGTMAVTGAPTEGPLRFPTPMADITTGMYTAMGVIGALYERERSGEGQAIDVALFDSQATWLSNLASAFLATGAPPHKRGNVHPNIAPYQPFHASDGSFILAAGTELLWERVLTVTDTHATIGTDLRFATNRDRVANREALEWALERVFARRSANEWIHAFESAGVPCGPILSPDQTLTHPHLRARDMIVELQHETAGPVRSLGNPIRLSRTPVEYRNAAPTLGRDTETILNELGFRADQIDRLRADGVV